MSFLPGILAEIAEVAGEAAAIAIADRKGGSTVWIPYELPADHWMIEAVGEEAAGKICAYLRLHNADGSGLSFRVLIPLGPAGVMMRARRRLAEMLRAGVRPIEAARITGLHERTAYRMQRRLHDRRNSDQRELF